MLEQLLYWTDLAGVAVFALSGALTAARKQMDLFGFVLIATVTGIGGGTLRDLLLGLTPVFWVREPVYVYVTTGAALLGFVTAHLVESRYRLLLWADAVGLSVFCLLGAEAALAAGVPHVIAVVMGLLSAVFGGLVRDILCHETPLILRKEIYATAALLGATVYVGLAALELERPWCLLAGFLAAFLLRALAILKGLSLPTYDKRLARSYEEARKGRR